MAPTPEDIISQMDQFLTGMENLAIAIAEYRTQLISKGIPEKLADEMTRDFAMSIWDQANKKNNKE